MVPVINRKNFGEVGGPIQQFVLPLVAKVDETIYPVGTGFIINPSGLFVTAAHVLEEAHKYGDRRMGEKGFYHHYELYVVYINNQIVGGGGDLFGGLLPVKNIWAPIDLDIGFGLMSLPLHKVTGAPIPTKSAILRPQIPMVNEIVTAAGYLKMSGDFRTVGSEYEMEFRIDTAEVTGKVTEVHATRRDSGLLRFPCFRVDAEFDHGMSGGPIMDASGRVCGVVCSGTDWGGGSWGSLVWPIFGCEIEEQSKSSGALEKVLLYDLAKEGAILTDDSFRKVVVARTELGHRTVTYRG